MSGKRLVTKTQVRFQSILSRKFCKRNGALRHCLLPSCRYAWTICNTLDNGKLFRWYRKCLGSFVNFEKRLYFRHVVCLSVRPSVSYSAWNNSATTERIFVKFYIRVLFENLLRKFNFHEDLASISGALHEELCTFTTILIMIKFFLELIIINFFLEIDILQTKL
jgi:hypothetical protein